MTRAGKARLIAIGDVHGCAEELAELLAQFDPQPTDRLVFLGDYVDRGPDSQGVIDQIRTLATRCRLVTLLGNHDATMLAALDRGLRPDDWRMIGGEPTLRSYGAADDLAAIPESHRRFLRECRLFYETPTHFFVHGNYDSAVPLDRQPEDLLMWTSLREYVPPAHNSGKIAVVGHTPQNEGRVLDLGYLLCLDTGCCYGGHLTAREVHTGETWQVASRQPRDPRW